MRTLTSTSTSALHFGLELTKLIIMLANFRSRIKDINSWLFAGIFFFLPIHVSPAYQITFVILVLSLIEGDFANKWQRLRREPLFWIFQAFFWVFVLSLLWTEDMAAGKRMVGRYGFFLLSGLYLTIARPDLVARCIGFFLAGCAFTESLAYYNWLQMHVFTDWPTGIRVKKSPEDTAPFVDRIMYTPALAWAGYLAMYQALKAQGAMRLVFGAIALTTAGNLIFSGGRTGLVAFLVLLGLLVFQRFAKRPITAFIVAISLVGGITVSGYSSNSYFKKRVDDAAHEVTRYNAVTHYAEAANSSSGQRINFYVNSWRIFLENPALGVGAGDFTTEYTRMNERHSPQWPRTFNPHNQYLFVLTTTGLLGGLIMLLVYLPPALWKGPKDTLSEQRWALFTFIACISIFESYLWRSNTSLLFVLFSSLLMQSAYKPATDGLEGPDAPKLDPQTIYSNTK